MSSQVNIHPNTWEKGFGGTATMTTSLATWPRSLKLAYEDGGPTIAGNHETTLFLDVFDSGAIRDLAHSADKAAVALLAYADELDEAEQV